MLAFVITEACPDFCGVGGSCFGLAHMLLVLLLSMALHIEEQEHPVSLYYIQVCQPNSSASAVEQLDSLSLSSLVIDRV